MDIGRFQGRISGMEHTPSLLDQVRHAIRLRHYNYSTERTYVDWVRRFILANGKRHPRELGAAEQEFRARPLGCSIHRGAPLSSIKGSP